MHAQRAIVNNIAPCGLFASRNLCPSRIRAELLLARYMRSTLSYGIHTRREEQQQGELKEDSVGKSKRSPFSNG